MSRTEKCHQIHPKFYRFCNLPVHHPGYHGDGDISWVGPEGMNRDGSRPAVHNHGPEDGPGLACPESRDVDGVLRGACFPSLTTAAAEARRLLAQPKPAALRWGRERWHFAGRVTLAGAGDRYRWELRSEQGHVLDTEYRAVSSMLTPAVRTVEAREGE